MNLTPVTVGVVSAFFMTTSAARAADEAVDFGIIDQDGECPGNPLVWAEDAVDSWDATFSVWGSYPFYLWDSSENWKDTAVDEVDWIGSDDDVDPYGVDHADVGLYVGHGNYLCGTSSWHSFVQMGDDSGECLVYTDDMNFGANGDLDILVIYACNSLQDCVVWGHGYDTMDGNGSSNFRMYMGFHGITYSWPWGGDDMYDFVAGSLSNDIGPNWMDIMYEDPVLPPTGPDEPWRDQCPTGLVYGGTSSQRTSYWDNGGWMDRRTLTASDTAHYHTLHPCDPAHGEAL